MIPEWFHPAVALQTSLVLPLIGLVLVGLTGEKQRNLRDGLTVVVAFLTFASVCTLVSPVLAGERPRVAWLYVLPNVPISFELEPLGMVFALVASGLWGFTSLYAFGYMRSMKINAFLCVSRWPSLQPSESPTRGTYLRCFYSMS